jgi:hypothetical protein
VSSSLRIRQGRPGHHLPPCTSRWLQADNEQVCHCENAEKDVLTSSHGGPQNWTNGTACRVIKQGQNTVGMWQGIGLVYCGRTFACVDWSHDGYCGPDNGPRVGNVESSHNLARHQGTGPIK